MVVSEYVVVVVWMGKIKIVFQGVVFGWVLFLLYYFIGLDVWMFIIFIFMFIVFVFIVVSGIDYIVVQVCGL